MLLRCLLPLALLPLAAVASAACTLTDPTLTLQSYRVDAQKERIAMYWQDRHGKAWGSLRSLLAGIDGDGRVQMAMNGGIYDKAYAPLGLYIEDGKRLTPVNRSAGGGNFFIRPGGVFLPKAEGAADVTRLHHYLTALEAANGIVQGSTLVAALVTETAAAMFRTGDYAGNYAGRERLVAMSWGAEDLSSALGARGRG